MKEEELKKKIIEILRQRNLISQAPFCSEEIATKLADEILEVFKNKLAIQRKELLEKVENSISLFKILKLSCKDEDMIEKKEAHDIFIKHLEALKKLLK